MEYDALTAELSRTLLSRGYPCKLLQCPPYDALRREYMLQKLYTRDKTAVKEKVSRGEVLVLKTEYSKTLRRLGLKSEIARLLDSLRCVLGQGFLERVKIFVAHPTSANIFLRTYKYNFPPSWKGSALCAGGRAEVWANQP